MSEGENLVAAWKAARDRLREAGVDTPAYDARLLLEAGAGVARTEILTDPYRMLSADQRDAVERLVARREAREPVSHILGRKHFWTFELRVTPDVLAPRPETETLVLCALDLVGADAPARVADLGAGTGAVCIAFAAERPAATIVAVDVSAAALAVAASNIAACGFADRIERVEDDWGAGLPDAAFDLVLSNPPYVRTGALGLLEPEVARYEPRLALDGGADGLDAYRRLLPQIARLLRPGGAFAVEIGQGQAEAVWALADEQGLAPEGVRADLAGIDRVVFGRRPVRG
ncbi:MAG: peptide chain release factor N(5)-glutamine methyltransferase [Alphaproteobacteria bacterium]|nr:peptide chain release factor N(5)-glutamine methyltransferase [Alphaproteobacteria bacterium]